MKVENKTKEQLINELTRLRRRTTKLEAAEAKREHAEQLLGILFTNSLIGFYIVQDGRFKVVSPQFRQISGYNEDEVIGMPALTPVLPEDRKMVREKAIKMLKGELSSAYEYRIVTKGGDTKWVMETVASIWYQERRAVLGDFMDITERKQGEEAIRLLAYHDSVSGLPNRVLFNDRLTLELAHAHRNQQKLGVMLLDLDRFKEVNDTLGHSGGDKLLQAVAERLTSLLRRSDTVARIGGDEYMLLLPEITGMKDTAKVAPKILEAIREPFMIDGHELHVTTSIGIAIYPNDGEDADTLMKSADIAMYSAKHQGRDNYQRFRQGRKRWRRKRAS